MFTCWEENEFDQSRCTKQIQNFEKCWQVNKVRFYLEHKNPFIVMMYSIINEMFEDEA